MLFSGRANPELAAKIADKLGVDLGAVTLKTFTNGEVYCRYEESIRGADVFIVQPTCGQPAAGSVGQRRAGGAAADDRRRGRRLRAPRDRRHALVRLRRQDKKSAPREPISARLVARMLEAAGADRVLTMDLHAGQIQGFFSNPVDHMTAAVHAHPVLRGPRAAGPGRRSRRTPGGSSSTRSSPRSSAPTWRSSTKERPAQQVAEIGYVIGDVQGKTAIIVDDIIDTAGTLCAAGQTVQGRRRQPRLRRRHARASSRAGMREPGRRALRADRRHRHHPAARRGARQRPRAVLRRAADRLDPPDLHRRLGLRRLRRREPAVLDVRRLCARWSAWG